MAKFTIAQVRDHQQAPGPCRPNGKTLAYILDAIIGKDEVEQIVINGQSAMLYIITTPDQGKTSELQEFYLGAATDVL